MIIYTCPKCGHDLLSEVLTCLPPIHRDYCPNCGWSHEEREEVVRIPYGGNSNITESTLNSIELKTDMCCDSVASINSTTTTEEVSDLLGEETVLKIEETLTEIFGNKIVDLNNPNFTDLQNPFKKNYFNNEACEKCSSNPLNGGTGICFCTLGLQEIRC